MPWELPKEIAKRQKKKKKILKVWVCGQTFGVSWIVTLLKHITSEDVMRGAAFKFHAVSIVLSNQFLKLSI